MAANGTPANVENGHRSIAVKELVNGTAIAGDKGYKGYSNDNLKTTRKAVPSGPWGGHGGFAWDDGAYTGIRQIALNYASAIDSITVEYDKNGTSVWSHKHGGSGGTYSNKIVFDYPREILVAISGHFGPFYYKGPPVIRSLTFHTNQKKHGPFGVQQGSYFQSATVGCRIVGFHGRGGNFLDAIGLYTQFSLKFTFGREERAAYRLFNAYVSSVEDIADALKVSDGRNWKPAPSLTWGGQGGNPWDDGVHCGIRQIALRWADAVDSITLEYARNEKFFWGIRHGGLGGGKCHTIRLNYPDEYLTCVSGYYSALGQWKPVAIRSLTFQSNLRKYGPYGIDKGTYFSSPVKGCKILGFCGKAGWYLDAIGVHMLAEDPTDPNEDDSPDVKIAWKEFALDLIHHTVITPRN